MIVVEDELVEHAMNFLKKKQISGLRFIDAGWSWAACLFSKSKDIFKLIVCILGEMRLGIDYREIISRS